MHKSLTDVEVVDTTRERVKTDDDVHTVSLDGVVGDGLEVLLLVTVVELRSGNLDPCCVSGRDSESVHTDRSELVNGRGVEERCVTGFKSRAALVTKGLAESPFVRSGGGVGNAGPPDRVVGLLLLEPTAKVSTVGLEGLPVDETAGSSGLSGGGGAGSSSCRADDPGRSSGLLASSSIGGAGETVRVGDGVLVAVVVRSLVGSVRRSPGLGVKVAVLANGDVVTGQDVSVEELASGLVCLHVGGGLSIASSGTERSIEGTTGEDLRVEESGLAIAVVRSVNGSVAIVGRRGEAISRLNGVVDVAVGTSNDDLEVASPLSSIVGVGRGDWATPEDTLCELLALVGRESWV